MVKAAQISTSKDRATISPENIKDGADLEQLESLLKTDSARLVGPDGTEVTMPTAVYSILLKLVRLLINGDEVSLVPDGKLMTTKEAADLLNVSRPHIIKLLDTGVIPSAPPKGAHRRVRAKDVIEYREDRDRKRRISMKKASNLGKSAGLYDD